MTATTSEEPRRPRILIVDADTSVRGTLKMILTSRGYDVMSAATGELAPIIAQTWPPDALIADMTGSISRCSL